MATKIRLQRFGKKGAPFYHVVVADSRAPRDGKFIERLGSYNPNTNPATVELNFDKALDWVLKGAQPTDTARAILSYRGVLYKKHLLGGVKKGAFDEATAEARFEDWLKAKEAKIDNKTTQINTLKEESKKTALAAEAKKKEARATAIAAKNTPPAEEPEEADEVPAESAPTSEESATEEIQVEEKASPASEEVPKTEDNSSDKTEE